MISLPSLIFSGLPPASMMVKPPQTQSKKAMPPPITMALPKIHLTNSWGSVGIGPRAVQTTVAVEMVQAI